MFTDKLEAFPELKTNRLRLRAMKVSDADDIAKLRSDVTVNRYIDRPEKITTKEATDFIEGITVSIRASRLLYWAINIGSDEKTIGTICIWNISKKDSCAEIGFELLPEFHGKGLMREALTTVMKYSFETMKLKTLTAWSHPDNKRSIKLLEKNNFRRDRIREKSTSEAGDLRGMNIYSRNR